MAASGYFNTGNYQGRYLQFSWKKESQNVANNTTTISWTLKGAGTAESGWYESGNFKVVIDGTTVFSQSKRIQLWNGTTVASGTYTFSHNADGSKSFTASAEGGIWYVAVNCRGTDTFTLDTIPRASQPSCITYPNHTQNVGEFGDTISIHTNRNSSAFTHTVRYAFGSASGTCINAETGSNATGIGTGFKWKIPEELMKLIPANTSGSGTIYVDTYNGSTKIGTKSCGFTATVPADVKPILGYSLYDASQVDLTYGSPVQGLSRIEVRLSPTPAMSSPIASYKTTINGVIYRDKEFATGVLTASGGIPVEMTVTDKRGRSATKSYTMSVQPYACPRISALSVLRCNEDGTANDRGEFVKVTFTAAIHNLGNKNTATYKLKYKKTSASTYTTVSLSALANTYRVENHSYIFAADGSSSYDVEVTATDRHYTATRSTNVSTAFTLINFHESGTGMRFGGVAEEENTFQNDLKLRQVGNSYAYQPEVFSGEKGYTLLASITLKALTVNAPIVFEINRRGALSPMKVYVRFASSSTTTDPDLGSITYEGTNYGVYMVKAGISNWKLYVDNTAGWSNPCLQNWYTTDNQDSRITVDFPSEQIAGTDTSALPTPFYRATPAKLDSLLDHIFPVGRIVFLFNHEDPAAYWGGTWERITNAFLWATDSSGTIGQTGGEKTHTLTADEMPTHTHGFRYTKDGGNTYTSASMGKDGTSTSESYLGVSNSVSAFANYRVRIDNAGGGAAHNNMPPYIQVSVWRRIA